jgi:hypothetical protein
MLSELPVRWVVMRIRVEIKVSMGRFTVYRMVHIAVRSLLKDGKIAIFMVT